LVFTSKFLNGSVFPIPCRYKFIAVCNNRKNIRWTKVVNKCLSYIVSHSRLRIYSLVCHEWYHYSINSIAPNCIFNVLKHLFQINTCIPQSWSVNNSNLSGCRNAKEISFGALYFNSYCTACDYTLEPL